MLKNVVLLLACMIFACKSTAAPCIQEIKWGKIIVCDNNTTSIYRDAKIWTSKSREWDWKETGTRHIPGIQIADIEEFIDKVDVVILTKGMQLALQVPQETINYISKKGKKYYVGQTEEMVKLYNSLVAQGTKVGGVFHSTC